jgi:serine/threonine-protein kinase RsbW
MSAGEANPPGPRTGPELELVFPPKPEYVRAARHTVVALARLHDVPDEVVDDLKLVVSEACTNAVSVNARSSGAPVRLVSTCLDDQIVIEVTDQGPVVDPSLLERTPEFDSEEFSFEKGLSLPLIAGVVDEVEAVPGPDGGTLLRMRLGYVSTVEGS